MEILFDSVTEILRLRQSGQSPSIEEQEEHVIGRTDRGVRRVQRWGERASRNGASERIEREVERG